MQSSASKLVLNFTTNTSKRYANLFSYNQRCYLHSTISMNISRSVSTKCTIIFQPQEYSYCNLNKKGHNSRRGSGCNHASLLRVYYHSSSITSRNNDNIKYDATDNKDTAENKTSIKSESVDTKNTTTTKKLSLQKNFLQQLQSLPNVITLTRIACTPLLSYLILSENYSLALGSCLFFGFTDYLDGYIAKNYNMSTVLGSYLDPLADKIMINTLCVSLSYQGLLPIPITILWLGRDVLLISATYYYITLSYKDGTGEDDFFNPGKVSLKIEPSLMSKGNTVLQFMTLSCGLIYPIIGGDIMHDVVLGLCCLSGGTTLLSGLSYIGGKSLISSNNASVAPFSSKKSTKK